MSGLREYGARLMTPAWCRVVLAGVVMVLIVAAYFPFAWSPPREVSNQVIRGADGSLRFGEMNRARTPAAPEWLDEVRESGLVHIQVDVAPQTLEQSAAIMILASDDWNTDFCIGQDQSNLVVWLRRPGSNSNGDPPFTIEGVFQPQQSSSVSVMLQQGNLRIEVDGRIRLSALLPTDSLRVWSQGRLALGDEVHGGRPWRGRISLAQVRTASTTIDYVRPNALSIPASYRHLPDHVEPFPPLGRAAWMTAFLDMLSFIPLGFLVVLSRNPPVRLVPATLLAGGCAVTLGVGKFLFDGRHTAGLNLLLESIGGLLGALLAWRLVHARRITSEPRGDEVENRRQQARSSGLDL